MPESRTAKSLKNAKVSFFYYFIFLILSFWSRKVFFDYLGAEITGLESTASNLFGVLNLAELGVGMSVTYFLYKPLFNKDIATINKIVALQGWLYRRVAAIIIVASCILMAFFPLIFKDIKVPLWNAYVVFSVLLLNSLIGYFINYRQIVLNTDQKGYKVARVTQATGVVVRLCCIFLFPIVPNPFLFYIALNVFSTLFSCWWLNHTIDSEYPWLSTKGINGKKVLKEYPDVIKKTKQVFIHRITSVILFNVTPLLMYAYSSLTIVAYYANYLLIVSKFRDVIGMAYNSMGAGIGNLIASGDEKKIRRVFWELYDSRFCIAFIVLLSIYFLSHQFIALWLGEEYVLGQVILLLLIINQSIFITRLTVDHYINGYGLFKDVWAPMVEGCINIVAALSFGALMGYAGVILGNITSQLLIICIWKPIFLFRDGFRDSVWSYFRPVIFRYSVIIADIIAFTFIFDLFLPSRMNSYIEFAFYSAIVFLIISIVIVAEFCTFSQGMRDFILRLKGILQHKFV